MIKPHTRFINIKLNSLRLPKNMLKTLNIPVKFTKKHCYIGLIFSASCNEGVIEYHAKNGEIFSCYYRGVTFRQIVTFDRLQYITEEGLKEYLTNIVREKVITQIEQSIIRKTNEQILADEFNSNVRELQQGNDRLNSFELFMKQYEGINNGF